MYPRTPLPGPYLKSPALQSRRVCKGLRVYLFRPNKRSFIPFQQAHLPLTLTQASPNDHHYYRVSDAPRHTTGLGHIHQLCDWECVAGFWKQLVWRWTCGPRSGGHQYLILTDDTLSPHLMATNFSVTGCSCHCHLCCHHHTTSSSSRSSNLTGILDPRWNIFSPSPSKNEHAFCSRVRFSTVAIIFCRFSSYSFICRSVL